jgi:hypothetical protein
MIEDDIACGLSRVDHNELLGVIVVVVVVVYQSPDLDERKLSVFLCFVFNDHKHLCFHCLFDCAAAPSVSSFLFLGEEGFHN